MSTTIATRSARHWPPGHHTSYPLCRGTAGDIVGVVHLRSLVESLLTDAPLDLAALAQPALMVPDRTPVVRLVELFRRGSGHLAVVIDEYGVVEGIVTPADLLTAIAGELHDRRSEEAPDIVRRADGTWLADGRTDIHRIERLLGQRGLGRTDAYATLAGFVLWELGRMPKVSRLVRARRGAVRGRGS